MRDHLNTLFDRFVRPRVRLGQVAVPSFQLCGYTGLAVAVALALALVGRRGLPLWPMAAVVIAACATFFALAFATKVVTGREMLVYYHHEIAVVTTAGLLLAALRQPVWAYLDATLLGVGAFLAFGRVGCLMASCCHGRPSQVGARYRHEHAEIGLPRYLVGVRLFPIQAVESLWVGGVVAVGAAMVWRGAAPGAAFAWYVILYDVGRFAFEWARGDPDRPYYRGFSQPQWLSLGLAVLVSLGELAGWLPLQPWHLAVAGGLALSMPAFSLVRRAHVDDTHRIAAPAHVGEIGRATLLAAARGAPAEVPAVASSMLTTSLGYRISGGFTCGPHGAIRHYTLSTVNGPPAGTSSAAFARVLDHLHPGAGGFEIIPGGKGATHLVARRPE